ncbi:MAG: YicC family protein [Chlorobi bacterium]|nr:YicC family protein [Chlorobiota bacterium]
MKSMTALSTASLSEHGIRATVEIRSLNGRYLEIACRLPKHLSHKEIELRELISSVVQRGSVQVTVKTETDVPASLALSDERIEAYWTHLEKLRKKLKISQPLTLGDILHIPDVFISEDEAALERAEQEWKVVAKTVRAALTSLDTMRKNEGKELARDIRARLKAIEERLDRIEQRSMQRVPQERERLRARIAQLFESDEIDEQRLQLEILLLADKLDCSEEIVRLRSHLKFFGEALKSSEPVGRQMTFLLQEMHREVNTIGAKASDAEISQHVVFIKEELERIREQVQNIE